MNATGFPPNLGTDPPGRGDDRASVEQVAAGRRYPCADGHIVFGLTPAGLGLRGVTHFLEWMQEEGDLEDWPEPDLEQWAAGMQALAVEDMVAATEALAPAVERVIAFIKEHTKAELFAEAVARDFMLARSIRSMRSQPTHIWRLATSGSRSTASATPAHSPSFRSHRFGSTAQRRHSARTNISSRKRGRRSRSLAPLPVAPASSRSRASRSPTSPGSASAR